ncbi:histidine phosphatase family protein [Henriciella barbarensis]|uniref:Histidine phosphatase family protein n=1 Tax=Henriciella barbarensis TaxID=86342 RepID=A0A399QYV2_9PROT|nr:histidine phosphatase family protein [Henriciella barbarensis]RIJ24306.1 histidine phosphatase family protein [Henriciella barbarensis]
MKPLTLLLTILAAAFAVTSCAGLPGDTGEYSDTTYTVYLVRHAEKQSGDDPSLTGDGLSRADTLADLLADKGIEKIWSSDYRRTRETAAPLAERLGMDVQLYDASDLQSLAGEITAEGMTVLVVGHSNTTPALAEFLGADPGGPIVEANEYDRLYLIQREGNATTSHDIQRFGARFEPQ